MQGTFLELIKRQSSPAHQPNRVYIYPKADGNLYYMDLDGVEKVIDTNTNTSQVVYVSTAIGDDDKSGLDIKNPVATFQQAIENVTGLAYTSGTNTKGASGTKDSTAFTIGDVIQLYVTTTYYTQDVDFFLTDGDVDWGGGATEPSPGATYNYTYGVGTSLGISSSNQALIICLDADSYTENLIVPAGVNIYAPYATIVGTPIQHIDSILNHAGNHVSKEYVVEVPITKANILAMNGTPVALVAGIRNAYMRFIDAVLYYDHVQNTYGGGGVVTINIGGGGAAVSTNIAAANSFGASADKVYTMAHLNAAGGYALTQHVGFEITNASGAFTDPGLPEEFTIQVTVAEDIGGDCTITLNGTSYTDVTLSTGGVNANAGEIQAYIDALDGWTATVLTDTVTVTADADGAKVDATFAQGGCNSVAATVTVTQQGVDEALGTGKVIMRYAVYNLT